MILTINSTARSEIQKDVDALTLSPKYFNIKVERAKTYFPIIEKIFREENVPDELKYLVIQESALISDAVSTSNAVGYWQFKAETAKEMGLKVNNRVDERMNISAASRGAAKYFKQSNTYFNNWLLVVQSYQMGIGGTMRSIGEEFFGERQMDVTQDTYWYVKKYLAHKVAFEHALGGATGQVEITPVLASGISLDEISKKSGVDLAQLKEYNKWAKDGTVPDDKDYTIVIPKGDIQDFNTLWLSPSKSPIAAATPTQPAVLKEMQINGLRAFLANQGETIPALAKQTNTDISDFIKWNDVSVDWKVSAGQIFYLQKKSKTSNQSTYTTKPDESLWAVSQFYGIRLKSLRRLNGHLPKQLKPGTVVYLAEHREAISGSNNKMIELDHSSPFDWGISGKSEQDYIIPKVETDPVTSIKPKADLSNQSGQSGIKEHIVSSGETLFSIASRYGLTVDELKRINDFSSDVSIKSGLILKLESPSNQRTLHDVNPTDTFYSIARKYGLSVKELMSLNNRQSFDLKPGEKLIVK